MVLAIGLGAFADTLVLRSAVRAQRDDGVVLLREIAELRGTEIARYGDLVVTTVPIGSPPKELGVEEIRRRLEQAGANWAKIDLEGRRVVVRPRIADSFGAPALNAPASVVPSSRGDARPVRSGASTGVPSDDGVGTDAGASGTGARSESTPNTTSRSIAAHRVWRRPGSEPVLAASVLSEHSVRALAAAAIVQALDESPDDLRLAFDGLDAATLAQTPSGVRLEIDPVGRLDADRVDFAVRWWRDGKVERRSNLSVFPEIARSATVSTRDLRKGDRPDPATLQPALCWVRPSERGQVLRASVIGDRSLATSIRAGEPILEPHLERPILVRRGDRIVVRTTVGSLALSVDAVAQSDGREGDLIDCVRVGSQARRDRNPLRVMVTGRGEAVVPDASASAAAGTRDHSSAM